MIEKAWKFFAENPARLYVTLGFVVVISIGIAFLYSTSPHKPQVGECYAAKYQRGLYRVKAVGKHSVLADELWTLSPTTHLMSLDDFSDQYKIVDCPDDLEKRK